MLLHQLPCCAEAQVLCTASFCQARANRQPAQARASRSVQQVPHSRASSRAHRAGGLSPRPMGKVRGAREERLAVRLPV